MPHGVEVVIEADRAAAEDAPDELFVLEAVEGAVDIGFAELRHRLAVRFLIAGRHERVERQRVVLGCRELLLHQAPEDANLDGIEGARNARPMGCFGIECRDESHAADSRSMEEAVSWSAGVLTGAFRDCDGEGNGSTPLLAGEDTGAPLLRDATLGA